MNHAKIDQTMKFEGAPKGIRLVVIGCGGFIGSHLLDQLLTDPNVRVNGIDPCINKISSHLENANLTLIRNSLKEPGVLDRLEEWVKDADVVINLAAICNPAEYNTRPLTVIYSNFLDSYPVVELCSKYKKWLIHFSTSEVYGRTISSYVPNEEYTNPDLYELEEDTTPLIMGPISNQRWSYASAKQLLERFVYAHHAERGLPFTIVRPLNFFGPRMDYIPGRDGDGVPRVLACFMSALLDGKPIQLVDGGKAKRTIVSIHDAIRAILLMVKKPDKAQNQIFNIGNRNNEVSIAELAELMRQKYAKVAEDTSYLAHPIENISSQEFYGEGYEDCDRRMPSVEKARNLLGWKPKYSLEETILETVAYYYGLYGGSKILKPATSKKIKPIKTKRRRNFSMLPRVLPTSS